jgi:polyphosphate kinase 2 (PPK2 family)
MAKNERAVENADISDLAQQEGKLMRKDIEPKLDQLHMELVKMQYWIEATGKKLVVLFRHCGFTNGVLESIGRVPCGELGSV